MLFQFSGVLVGREPTDSDEHQGLKLFLENLGLLNSMSQFKYL